VVAWHGSSFFLSSREGVSRGPWRSTQHTTTPIPPSTIGDPEAIIVQHSRAVNRLAWHPNKPALLLTASQDSTVKLFDRRASSGGNKAVASTAIDSMLSWFGLESQNNALSSRHLARPSWHCVSTFQPRSEAVRDIKWNPFNDNAFAMVTDSGYLIIYDIRVTARPWVKVAAHAGEATTIDWHPTRPCIIATGGGRDRRVKVWDIENLFCSRAHEENVEIKSNANTKGSDMSSSSEKSFGNTNNPDVPEGGVVPADNISSKTSMPMYSTNTQLVTSRSLSVGTVSRSHNTVKLGAAIKLHTLSISSPVTRLKWRPPTMSNSDNEINEELINPHDFMLGVATAPISGANAGGYGSVALWSCYRPFMPLAIVEGHEEGAVTDFVWLDFSSQYIDSSKNFTLYNDHYRSNFTTGGVIVDKNKSETNSEDEMVGAWQHILSVGRDGQCLLQNFAHGEKPLSQVSPSVFAVGSLTPFQSGCGSLQILSVHQKVPVSSINHFSALKAAKEPDIVLSLIDHSDNGEFETKSQKIKVAPEMIHISRFAKSYRLYTDSSLCTTRSALCLHNAKIAEKWHGYGPLSRMWNIIASLLLNFEADYESKTNSINIKLIHPISYILWPTLASLLRERGDAGDIQTCVSICEIVDVFQFFLPEKNDKTFINNEIDIPGLDIEIIREWYFAYIELLHQMCLFSQASELISACRDPIVSALNQQSTTIHESCPVCGKPVQTAKRACKTCRRQIGLCFICHQPVKGIFVWCPGCGHGGHLEHALKWFGSGQELCPTGCGHKCNMLRQTTFPMTHSFNSLFH